MATQQAQTTQTFRRLTACTVFVRFIPPTAAVRRHHLEDLFSAIGPIKKSSVIHNKKETDDLAASSSYAFVKYTDEADARKAASTLNFKTLKLSGTEKVQLKVELASAAHQKQGTQKGSAATTTAASSVAATATVVTSNKRGPNHHKQQQTDRDDKKDIKRGKEAEIVHADDDDNNVDRSNNSNNNDAEDEAAQKKRSNRLILRNLSFYAKESHIRKVLQAKFGPLAEVHIPLVANAAAGGEKKPKGSVSVTHRGFCFVVFDKEADAKKCLESTEDIVIAKRPVKVAYSLNKTVYEIKKQQDLPTKKKKIKVDEEPETDEANSDSDSDDGDDPDGSSSGSDEDDDNGEEEEDIDEEKQAVKELEKKKRHRDRDQGNKDDEALSHKRTLFVRNLPFDATRHDLFQIFHKFGYVTSIYLVKDKETGIPKGTAFVAYQKQESAQKALDAAASTQDAFVSQREVTNETDATAKATESGSGLACKGRRLFVDLAVDKETASTLTVEKGKDATKMIGKDRRHLYLQNEGRVDNNPNGPDGGETAWDDLPEGDQLKRQQAWSDKNTKLRSPIFSINPTRLSIRNLSKNVDESGFKRLCVEAVQLGLENNSVTAEDQISHWKAKGEMTTRDILARIQELGGDAKKNAIVPKFDDKNIKHYIPSVFIDRNFAASKKRIEAPSRGFGFVDFEHHAHALACLRELNNNPKYADDFVTGGRHAMDAKRRAGKRRKRGADAKPSDFVGENGRAKVPRLVVEFAVENVVKAKQQLEHRAHQQANFVKQRIEKSEPTAKEKKKKRRGAVQREKKRKLREEGDTANTGAPLPAVKEVEKGPDASGEKSEKKVKMLKPPKKRKVDKEDETFTKLVDTYKQAFAGAVVGEKQASTQQGEKKKEDGRWFE